MSNNSESQGENILSCETKIKVEFYDVDSMNIVYHGNYIKYFEVARCNLLEKIGYTYNDMKNDGYGYPIVKADLKYISPAFFGDELLVTATIDSYDGLFKVKYVIENLTTNKLCVKGSTAQAAVRISDLLTMFTINDEFNNKINEYINNNK